MHTSANFKISFVRRCGFSEANSESTLDAVSWRIIPTGIIKCNGNAMIIHPRRRRHNCTRRRGRVESRLGDTRVYHGALAFYVALVLPARVNRLNTANETPLGNRPLYKRGRNVVPLSHDLPKRCKNIFTFL